MGSARKNSTRCGRPRRGRAAVSRNWSAMQSARSCSSRRPQVRLPSGTASQSVRPSNTIAFTTSADAVRGSGFRRQRSVDRPRAVTGPTTFASARAMGSVGRGRREASQFRSRRHRDIHISRSQRQSGCRADMEGSHLQTRHSKDSSLRAARPGAVVGIRSTRGPAQAVRRRCHQLCDHEACANPARIFDHHFAVVGFRLVA